MRFDVAGHRVSMTLVGARAAGGLTDGRRVIYRGARRGTDLVYVVNAMGLKEELVVTGTRAPTRFRFRLNLGADLRLEPSGDGGFRIRAAQRDATVIRVPPAYMYAADQGSERRVHVPMTAGSSRGRVDLTLRPDRSWLRRHASQGRVIIDPSLDSQQAQACTIFSDQVTVPDENDYCGTTGDFVVGRWPGGGMPYGEARSLVKFDLSAVPAGTTIVSAALRAMADTPSTVPAGQTLAPHPVSVYRVISAWDRAGTTWSWRWHDGIGAQPTPWSSPGGDHLSQSDSSANVPAAVERRWASWDVRASVQQWVNDPASNHGLILRSDAASGGIELCGISFIASYACTNGGNLPVLQVVYGSKSEGG